VRALPAVELASATYSPPLSQNEFRQTVVAEGQVEDPDDPVWVGTVIAQSDYFRTVGVELRQGRAFDGTERAGEPPVAVINETMALAFWSGQDPLGQRFSFTGGISGSIDRMSREFFPREPFTVIGVVEDVRRGSLDKDPQPEFYRPHTQMGWSSLSLMVRATGETRGLTDAIRRIVGEQDAGVAVSEVTSMGQLMSRSVAAPRFRTLLMGGFAGIACVLAMVGVYAVMAYAVARRTREIGIRMALGAPADRVLRDVLRRGMGISLTGVTLGLVASAAGSRALGSMLFEVSPTDPGTFLAVAAAVGAVALLASYLPARRASRVDPVRSLQAE
jgi:putative ABC transport system permease protein